MSEDPIHFDEFSKLPSHLVMTSLQVMKFSGRYVVLDDDKKWFDWKNFHSAVNNYKGGDMSFDKYNNNTINQSHSTVSTMVDKIVGFLRDAMGVKLGEDDIKAISASIESTFTNLETAEEQGFASFSSKSSAHNSSWEYRILFAFPNPDLEDFFYSLITTIELEADIQEKSSWWGLTSSTSKNFSAQIDAMRLVVMKGFMDPSQ